MAHYQLKIAYDGSDFSGFQRQENTRTVQLEFEKALRAIGWKGESILAAGRTDTGVHASGQVVSFELEWNHSEEKLKNALNANLPGDIAVMSVNTTTDFFHPRYEAISRCYQYHIYCQPSRNPLRDRYAWRVWLPVKLQDLQYAASMLVGTYNFEAFGFPPQKGGDTTRTVYAAQWSNHQDEFLFVIRANGFLYHMIRKIVFIQVKVAQGLSPVERYLEGLNNQVSQMPGLAPPNGLELVEVQYQN